MHLTRDAIRELLTADAGRAPAEHLYVCPSCATIADEIALEVDHADAHRGVLQHLGQHVHTGLNLAAQQVGLDGLDHHRRRTKWQSRRRPRSSTQHRQLETPG